MSDDTTRNPRYEGSKSVLRLLELYVLDAIGEIDETNAAMLEMMEPMLRDSYSATGNWREVIEHVMEFPPDTIESIRDMWTGAKDQGTSPEQFAMMVVDVNFGDAEFMDEE